MTLKRKNVAAAAVSLTIAVILAAGWLNVRSNVTAQTLAARGTRQTAAPASSADRLIGQHAQQMIEQGRQIFRYDTFGSEAFWGDALQLHKALAGEKNGGLGGGVSPKTALSVGSRSTRTPCPPR